MLPPASLQPGVYSPLSSRAASQSTIPMETDTLSECFVPYCGISTHMKHFFLYAFLIALTFCGTAFSSTQSASAQTTQSQTVQTPLFPRLDSKYDKSDSVVLLDSTTVNVLSNGSGTFTYTRRIKYLTSIGARSGRVITYGYDPLTAYARFTAAHIIHNDNTITPIDLTTATDYAAPAHLIYWGSREILLEPGAMAPGDVLEYTIEKKGFTYALLTDGESAPAPSTQAQPATIYSYQIPFTPDADDASRFVPPMEGSFYDIVPLWVGTPTQRKVYSVTYPKGMAQL